MSTHDKNPDFLQGLKHLHNKAWDQALSLLSKVIETHGFDTPELFVKRAQAFLGKGKWDEAIEDFKTALHLGAAGPELFPMLAEAYRGKGWWDEAIHFWGKALEAVERQPEYYFRRGLAYFDKGWFNEAVEHFLAAANLDPKDARFPYAMAVALRARGQAEEALKHLEKAIQLGGDALRAAFETSPFKAEYVLSTERPAPKAPAPEAAGEPKKAAKPAKAPAKKASAKKPAKAAKASKPVLADDGGPSMLEAACKVLEAAAKPLHYKEITKEAIARKLITTAGATPEQSMRTAISREIASKGARARFRRHDKPNPGFYGLAKWDK